MDNNMKIITNQGTDYIRVCTKFEGHISICEDIHAEKIIWPPFGREIGQCNPIAMKLKLDV